ncbi:putative Protein disulfide-isomerase [Blattamonas nauphoetae]|uniref:protein disulfide-isomerase n=1 Tax=Blattamonas nauphoetae TaxID=2049346 RepID=A0ABQ9Y5R9_9EUKA|nr:putative Protein disulfide-isomerase [Blattamonas nauphoetae]
MVLALFLLSFAHSSDITQLTSENFEEAVNRQPTLIKYFSQNCFHCIQFAPTYEDLASHFSSHNDTVTLAEVDCDVNVALCDKESIEGYPSLIFYSSINNPEKFEGERDYETLVKFVSERTGIYHHPLQSNTVTLDAENYDSVTMDPSKNVLVAFTAPWCTHCKRLKPELARASTIFQDIDDVVIGIIDAEENRKFCRQFKIESYPTILFYPAHREGDDDKIKALKLSEEQLVQMEHRLNDEFSQEQQTDKTSQDDLSIQIDTPKEEEIEDGLPAHLRRKGANLIETLDGDRSLNSLVDFINQHAGTYRTFDGGVEEMAGFEEVISDAIVNLVHAITQTPLKPSPNTPDDLTVEAEQDPTSTKTHSEDIPTSYIPTMEEVLKEINEKIPLVLNKYTIKTIRRYVSAIQTKGYSWIQSEAIRLRRILSSGALDVQQRMELTIRMNVLEMFHLQE